MAIAIDLKNAVENIGNNFNCLLMKLIFKADEVNFKKLSSQYPIEAEIVRLYKNDCSYKKNTSEVDYCMLERRAIESFYLKKEI